MKRCLAGVIIAVLAAAVLYVGTAFADHRPGNLLVMGGTLSLTGRYAVPAGRVYNARKLYVDELNARGGLLGHRVELRILDDKSDIRTAIEVYEKLITQDKVDLVLGPYSSGIADAVANVLDATSSLSCPPRHPKRSGKEEGSTFSITDRSHRTIKKEPFTSPSR